MCFWLPNLDTRRLSCRNFTGKAVMNFLGLPQARVRDTSVNVNAT
jgi:hypothetical protein